MGTPKTLREAIKNGLTDSLGKQGPAFIDGTTSHVADFIRQKLGVLMLSEDPAEVAAARKLQELLLGDA